MVFGAHLLQYPDQKLLGFHLLPQYLIREINLSLSHPYLCVGRGLWGLEILYFIVLLVWECLDKQE